MQNYFTRLQETLGTENVFVDRASIISFCACKRLSSALDATALPEAVVRPRHAGHIRDLIKLCREEQLHLQIKGGGTSGLNALYPKNTLLLLTTGMDRILDLDVENRTVRIQSGLSVSAFNKFAAQHGLYYPHGVIPASPATIGGQIAANLPDAHTYKFGSPTTLVEELEVYLSTGDSYTLTCQNDQSPDPGLPVAPLFCGSRGLLGLIAGIKIRLIPLPKKRLACLFKFPNLQEAISASSKLINAGLTPDTFEILDKEAAAASNHISTPLLYVTFSDMETNFPSNALAGLSSDCTIMSEEEDRDFRCQLGLWQIRLQSQADSFLAVRAWIPQSHLAIYVENLIQICSDHGVKTAFSIHAGLAFLNIILHSAPKEKLNLVAQKLFAIELMVNNRMTDESESALDKKAWDALHADAMKLSKDLVRCFDPVKMFSFPLF